MSSQTAAASTSSALRIQRDPAYPSARLPTRGSALAAGYDLYAAADVVLPARNGRVVVPTGIRVAVPRGTYGRVAPRSGLASKHGIDVGAGVIDADYRGLLGVLLFNLGDADFEIKTGDRIAQLVLEQICTPPVVEVASLDETERGAAGFGSTGGFGVAVAVAADAGVAPSGAGAATAEAGAAGKAVESADPTASPSKKRRVEAGGEQPLHSIGNTAA